MNMTNYNQNKIFFLPKEKHSLSSSIFFWEWRFFIYIACRKKVEKGRLPKVQDQIELHSEFQANLSMSHKIMNKYHLKENTERKVREYMSLTREICLSILTLKTQ